MDESAHYEFMCKRSGAPLIYCAEPFAALARAHEFSILCPSLIDGMDGVQRQKVVRPLGAEPDPHRRSGPQADTFMEFQGRVRQFAVERLPMLPPGTVICGHGIWCGMLKWQSERNFVEDGTGMAALRAFQQSLRMSNAAVLELDQWNRIAETRLFIRNRQPSCALRAGQGTEIADWHE